MVGMRPLITLWLNLLFLNGISQLQMAESSPLVLSQVLNPADVSVPNQNSVGLMSTLPLQNSISNYLNLNNSVQADWAVNAKNTVGLVHINKSSIYDRGKRFRFTGFNLLYYKRSFFIENMGVLRMGVNAHFHHINSNVSWTNKDPAPQTYSNWKSDLSVGFVFEKDHLQVGASVINIMGEDHSFISSNPTIFMQGSYAFHWEEVTIKPGFYAFRSDWRNTFEMIRPFALPSLVLFPIYDMNNWDVVAINGLFPSLEISHKKWSLQSFYTRDLITSISFQATSKWRFTYFNSINTLQNLSNWGEMPVQGIGIQYFYK